MRRKLTPPPQAKGKHDEDEAITIYDKLSEIQREKLAAEIIQADHAYRGMKSVMEVAPKFTLHEIATPLTEVIETLENEANRVHILIALGGLTNTDEAVAWHQRIVSGLRTIKDNLPPAPPPRRRGKPIAHDLYRLVRALANIWERWTKTDFTRDWHKGKPASAAMWFVYDVVKVIDETRLPELSTVTKNVVAERRKAAGTFR